MSLPRRGRSRRAGSVLVALAVLGTVSGCAGIPASTQVTAQAPVDNLPAPQGPNVEFYGPREGAPPREIVLQFLRANGTTDADYAVAREYLAPSARQAWRTGGTVAVNTGERDWDVVQTGDNTISVTVHEVAVLDGTGHLTRLAKPTKLGGTFTMGKVGGEWRITQLPTGFGTWVASEDFTRAFQPQNVYFADRSTRTLVPDRQWFRTDGVAAALAKAVLSPPPEWMRGLPLNAPPEGTALQVDSVPVDSATASANVDLTSAALDADPSTRTALWAAMLATLEQVPGVSRVTLTADGSRLGVPGGTSQPSGPQDLGYDLAGPSQLPLIERTAHGMRWVGADKTVERGGQRPPVPSIDLPTIGPRWSMVAADGQAQQFAAVSGNQDGTLARWVQGRLTVLPPFGTRLCRPSFTDRHELWVAGRTLDGGSTPGPRSALWMIDTALPVADAQPQAVTIGWLGGSTIISAKLAADADRVALVVQDRHGSSRLLLAAVVRDRSGNPTALTQPLDLSAGMTDITSLSWVDDGDLVVLARLSDGVRQPVIVPLDGSPLQELSPVAGADEVVATGLGSEDIHVLTQGRLAAYDRVAATWERSDGVIDYVVPGA